MGGEEMGMDQLVPLIPHLNNVGISPADQTGTGHFNVWRNSFAAEHLPRGRVSVHGVPFDFPGHRNGEPDNIRCAGQYVTVPSGRYDWIYVLAAAERRAEDEIALHFQDGDVDFEPLRVSDFWHAVGAFGERSAFVSPVMHYPHHVQRNVEAMLWQQRVPVTRRAPLTAFRLPDNIAIHVFAATLRTSSEPAGPSGPAEPAEPAEPVESEDNG
jgi:hypothetical protein